MPDPDDAALTELFQRPTTSIADEDQAFGTIVARARSRVRRRRLTIAGVSLFIVATLVGSVVVISRRTPERVRIEGAHHPSTTDVTFAVFSRPATAADALPETLTHEALQVDAKIGSRLSIRTRTERIYVFARVPSCLGLPSVPSSGRCPAGRPVIAEQYCVALVRADSAGTSCTTAAGIAQFGAEYGTSSNGSAASAVTYGLVPDFVTRVSYAGHDVPIVGNAFVVEGENTATLVFSTPDGDKTALTMPTPTPTTATRTTVPGSTRRAVLAPAISAPVRDECTVPITRLEDGNVSPLLCAGGGVNTNAWAHYASGHVGDFAPSASAVMQLAAPANATEVFDAMCSDYTRLYGTGPLTTSAEKLASAYYGWTFDDSRITTFDHQNCPAP
jgi:hypothetical protein